MVSNIDSVPVWLFPSLAHLAKSRRICRGNFSARLAMVALLGLVLVAQMDSHTAFTSNSGGMKPWIVDTGASDHMTGDATLLQNYKPSSGHLSVLIADGSSSKIAGTGSIELTKELYLNSVLHVPNLDCNLLSISKLACDLQCVTKFYPNLCVFQDLKIEIGEDV